MSTPNDAGTPSPVEHTAAAPVSAPSDAGTPPPAERTAQGQGKAPGPRVAQRETPGPRAARPEVRGPRVARPRVPGPHSAQQGSPEVVLVRRENLQEKDRQVTVSRKQRRQLGIRRRCGGGGVGEIRLVKNDVREIRTRREVRSNHQYPLWSGEYPRNTQRVERGASL